ncbi:MAG: GNAT family protein [Candidatus Lokiarchaeota archaeon]|jgi:ribosomal protein S18 acetylase RimI-like enzyme
MKKVIEIKNGEQVIIRHIEESDIDGVWDNFNQVIDEAIYLPVLFPVNSQYEKFSWFNSIQKENEICIVAIHSKLKSPFNVIGQCEISNSEWDAAVHIAKLGVIVKSEFRNMGIGYHLIDFAIKESKRLNKKEKITLSTFTENKRALHLYKKMGFKTVGIRKKQFYMNSRYYDEVLMELWIDDYLKK